MHRSANLVTSFHCLYWWIRHPSIFLTCIILGMLFVVNVCQSFLLYINGYQTHFFLWNRALQLNLKLILLIFFISCNVFYMLSRFLDMAHRNNWKEYEWKECYPNQAILKIKVKKTPKKLNWTKEFKTKK